jgi:hypothetical protein
MRLVGKRRSHCSHSGLKLNARLKSYKNRPMGKTKLTGQNLDRVFNSKLGQACMCRAIACIKKRANLKLKTRPKQLLGLAFALPGACTIKLLKVVIYGFS